MSDSWIVKDYSRSRSPEHIEFSSPIRVREIYVKDLMDTYIPLWFFPALIALLQGCAGVRFLLAGRWRLAIVWFGVCLSNAAFAGVK